MQSRLARPLTYLFILCLAFACGPAPAPEEGSSGVARVVTTTGMIADAAARIAGDLATVEALMGPGVDPHLFKASEGDVRRLAEADLILYNGLHLEGKMADILVKLARSRPVVAVSEAVPADALREPPELAGQYDPHLWFDVSLWAQTISPMVEALTEILPEHRAAFEARGEAWRQELDELDAWVESQIAAIPEARRVMVTAHDAFGYFGDRYGIEVVGLQGISTLAEAGLQDMDRVVDLVVEREIPAIFVESSVPRRAIEAVREACLAKDHEVTIGGELFSDALGARGTPEGTYPGMVRHNVETVVGALR